MTKTPNSHNPSEVQVESLLLLLLLLLTRLKLNLGLLSALAQLLDGGLHSGQ